MQRWPFDKESAESAHNIFPIILFIGFVIFWWISGFFKTIGISVSILIFMSYIIGFTMGQDWEKHK